MIDTLKNRLRMVQTLGLEDSLDHYDLRSVSSDCLNLLSNRMIKPKTEENHVGVEIEFLSDSRRDDMFDDICTLGLLDKVSLGTDCSIETDGYGEGYEIKIIDVETNICETITKVCKLMRKWSPSINDSCGLHVHIDTRQRDRDMVYCNFFRAQALLYKLVNPDRADAGYSSRNNNPDYVPEDDHSYGVEKSNKSTIEIRMHHATLSDVDINNWINLLVKIANKRKVYKSNRTYSGLINVTNFSDNTKKFIKDRLNEISA